MVAALIVTISDLLQFIMPVTLEWLRLEPLMVRNGKWASAKRAPGAAELGPLPDEWHCLLSHMRLVWAMADAQTTCLVDVRKRHRGGIRAAMVRANAWLVRWSTRCIARMPDRGGLRDVLRREPVGFLVLTAVVLKLTWEQAFGPMPGSRLPQTAN
jgi:hypothetical protein